MDYLKAFERAVNHIEENLGESLSVQDVARVAGYSYYHFARQFSAILGESVGSYIRGRRLADAAKKLLCTKKRVIDIAVESGFGSGEAFSKAFKDVYCINPQQYRKRGLNLYVSMKERLDAGLLNHRTSQITVYPQIVELPELKAAGLRGRTTLRDNVLPKLWQDFLAVKAAVPHQSRRGRGFGICEACGEGNNLYTMHEDVEFSEIAAVEVENFEGLVAPFVPKILKGGRYAVFTHKGSLRQLKKTFAYIWGTWFINERPDLDEREDFELYDERFLGYDHPNTMIELYIPLR